MITKKALIIDDERSMRTVLEEALCDTHECTTVCGGREGFRLATEPGIYDIITMDIAMPDWDGISALSLIETINPNAKIIVVSGNISPEEEERFNGLSCVRKTLRKPFSISKFIQAVEIVENEE